MSNFPPKKPCAPPTRIPRNAETSVSASAKSMLTRKPWIRRDRTSRALASVPSQCSAEGAWGGGSGESRWLRYGECGTTGKTIQFGPSAKSARDFSAT